MVLLHGGCWRPEYDRVHVRPMSEALAAHERSTVTREYRRDTDAVAAFLGEPAAGRADLDPERSAPTASVRILHGAGEGIVPLLLSESYCAGT